MALSRNLVNAAVVLAAVLGSRTAEMSVTRRLITHGSKASRLVKVRCWEPDNLCKVVDIASLKLMIAFLTSVHIILNIYLQGRFGEASVSVSFV